MKRTLVPAVVVACITTFSAGAAAHDAAFWKALAANHYEVPAGESEIALMSEASSFLGSSDPELRDDIAYSAIVQWVFVRHVIPPDQLRPFLEEWEGNLERGIGERETGSVLRRSFSALSLSVLAALDNERPYLTREEFRKLLAVAIHYLESERDLRGFDPKLGWIHATAHTADLLKFLARSRHLEPADQRTIVRALVARMSSADTVFTHGEDERLARVVLSLVARSDFDVAAFQSELAAVSVPKFESNETVMTPRQNVQRFFTTLYLLLNADERVQKAAHLPQAREAVLEAAKRTL